MPCSSAKTGVVGCSTKLALELRPLTDRPWTVLGASPSPKATKKTVEHMENHGKTIGKYDALVHGIFHGDQYPLVNVDITMENHH